MTEHEHPDSPRFARRLAGVIEADLSDRADEANFTSGRITDVFDERKGIHTWQIEAGSPDGSRAMITVTPMPA